MRKTAVRAVALAAVCFLSVFGTCSYAKEATSEPIQIVVLGDSIAKGYCGANKPELYCYGQTVAEEIAQENHICIRIMRKTDLPLENSTKRC